MPLSGDRFIHHENKKEEILHRAFAEKIRQTRDLIEDLVTCPPEQFVDTLNSKVQAIADSATPETRAKLQRLHQIETEIEKLEPDESTSAEETNKRLRALGPLTDELVALTDERTSGDVVFQERIEILRRNMLSKFADTEKLCEDGALKERVCEFLQKRGDIVAESVLSAERDSAFTVKAIIARDEMDEKFERSLGIFFANSPVFIVKDDPKHMHVTTNHERMHAITEGLMYHGYPTRYVSNVLSTAETAFPIMGKTIFETLARKIPGKRIVDMLHGEVVAALERAMETNFGAPVPKTGAELLSGFFGFKMGHPDRFLHAFETAGNETAKVLKLFSDFKTKHANEPLLVEWVESMEKDFKKEFNIMARGIEQANDTIDFLYGDRPEAVADARQELLTLACFLRPSQYKHADAYMHKWTPKS